MQCINRIRPLVHRKMHNNANEYHQMQQSSKHDFLKQSEFKYRPRHQFWHGCTQQHACTGFGFARHPWNCQKLVVGKVNDWPQTKHKTERPRKKQTKMHVRGRIGTWCMIWYMIQKIISSIATSVTSTPLHVIIYVEFPAQWIKTHVKTWKNVR